MGFLANIPIKRKLTLIAMLTTGVALALACAAFAIYDQIVVRRQLVVALSATAQMIGFNSASALSFDDPSSAEQTLQSLSAQPQVVTACVYDRDGTLFATYQRAGDATRAFPARADAEHTHVGRDMLELTRRITFAGEHVGFIYLRTDLRELYERLARSALIFVVVMLGAGLVAYVIVSRLQRVISEPVSRLAAVAGQVATNNNYSVRVSKHGDDEVGALIDGFNAMLAQIQLRDAALQRAHDELERRVDERTRELASSLSLLNATLDATTDAIIAVDLMGRVVSFNSRFAAMWKVSPEMMARRDSREITRHVAAQTRDPDGLLRLANEAMTRPDSLQCDVIELIDGQTFERYVHPQRVEGRNVGVVLSYRDVTERKQAQQQAAREKARLQFIFESVPVGISLRQSKMSGESVRLLNDAHLRICGLSAADTERPGIFAAITHPEDYPRQLELQARLNSREIDRFTLEKRYVRPDGDIAWVTFSMLRHYYADGSYDDLCTVVDVTPLKRVQEHAAREQARFKFIFDSVPVGICVDNVRSNGERDRLLNDAHLRIVGLSREQAVAGIFPRMTHPDDLPHQEVLRAQLKQGLIARFSIEKRYIRSDGSVVWVAYTVQRQRYPDGGYQDLSTVVDITALKRAQEEVAAERARFKFIFESIPIGISLTLPGVDETPLVNPAHDRITGLSATEMMEPGAFERVTHPEDWERQRLLTHRYKHGEIDRFALEKRYLQSDGRVVWVALTRRMFTDADTGRKHSITTLVDITDLKAAQDDVARERARFKFIFDVVPIGISLVASNEVDNVVVNPAHERITGVTAAAARLPGAFERVSHPDDYRRQLELTARVNRGEVDHYSIEKRYIHPDGSTVWAVLTNRTFTDPATGQQQSVTTLIDITERKQAEAKLAETHKQLLDISRQAGMAEVATGVLHNVGNVLNSVNVSTTMLGELVRQSKIDKLAKLGELLTTQADLGQFFATDPRAEKVPGFVRTLATHLQREQTELLGELESLRKNVEHIKDIVAMQQSYAKVCGVSEAVSVAELIEDALRMNAGGFARQDVTIIRDFQANPTVTLEKHKVLQILVNLMRNAKFACDDSGRTDKQMILRVWTEFGRVKIAVVDNGVGIPAENLTRIFSHGFTTRKQGHGFGLHSGAIAAKELGGALIAQSEGAGCGATFILELPLNSDAKAA